MARRKKSGLGEDLMHAVAKLPWWAGLLLAVASCWVLHRLALQPNPPPPVQPGQIQGMVVRGMVKALAGIGQYAVPLICVAGAAMSVWQRRHRRILLDQATNNPAAEWVDGLRWQQFEQLVGEAFRRQGYAVRETGGAGADGGIDLVLRKGSETFLVQCKQWKAFKVGVGVVRELYGLMAAQGAAGGFVVTSGRFTAEAAAFASGRHVTLIDGPALRALIGSSVQGDPRLKHRRAAEPCESGSEPVPKLAPASTSMSVNMAPACPACAKPMVPRRARRGVNAGQSFWGCGAYPACRGTRPRVGG